MKEERALPMLQSSMAHLCKHLLPLRGLDVLISAAHRQRQYLCLPESDRTDTSAAGYSFLCISFLYLAGGLFFFMGLFEISNGSG